MTNFEVQTHEEESCNIFFLNYTGDVRMELIWTSKEEKESVSRTFMELIEAGHQIFEVKTKRGFFKRKEVIGEEMKTFDPDIKTVLVKHQVKAHLIDTEEQAMSNKGTGFNPETDSPKKNASYVVTPRVTAG